MTRAAAISRAQTYFDSGAFKADLARRVAIPTESQNPERAPDLARYLESEIQPALEKLGFTCRTLTPGARQGAVPVCRAHRGPCPADRARLWPWRRHPRARCKLARGPLALDADREGRPLLRARRGRQQGPAHHQHRRAGGGARRARQARLQRQMADRDGRGNRLAGPARAVRRAQGTAQGRRAGRLGRTAPHRRSPDDFARHARRLPDRPLDRCARRRASLGQLGRAALEPGDPARARALDHHEPEPGRSAFPNGCRTASPTR